MRQHRRHCSNRTGGMAVIELSIDLAGNTALLQREDDFTGMRPRPDIDRNSASSDARRADRHPMLGEACTRYPDLLHQGEKRRILNQHFRERTTNRSPGADAKEILGRAIQVSQAILGIDH